MTRALNVSTALAILTALALLTACDETVDSDDVDYQACPTLAEMYAGARIEFTPNSGTISVPWWWYYFDTNTVRGGNPNNTWNAQYWRYDGSRSSCSIEVDINGGTEYYELFGDNKFTYRGVTSTGTTVNNSGTFKFCTSGGSACP